MTLAFPFAPVVDACINVCMPLLLCEFKLEEDRDRNVPDEVEKNLIIGAFYDTKEQKIVYRSVLGELYTTSLYLGGFYLGLLIFA